MRIFTIGHSNRSLEEFTELLQEFELQAIADIRHYPSSRKFPHFNQGHLEKHLRSIGIEYRWFEGLGGRRHEQENHQSPNTGIESPGFRNYADYMMSDEFYGHVKDLLSFADDKSTAVMCAEKLFWKCHRRLLCDYLYSLGIQVEHILEKGNLTSHKLTPGVVIEDEGRVIYPPSPSLFDEHDTFG